MTAREPQRSEVLADLLLTMVLPRPGGLGFTITIVDPADAGPFEVWDMSIAPFRMRWEWCNTMDGLTSDTSGSTIARIALEQGQWRVVELLGPDERKFYQQLSQILGSR